MWGCELYFDDMAVGLADFNSNSSAQLRMNRTEMELLWAWYGLLSIGLVCGVRLPLLPLRCIHRGRLVLLTLPVVQNQGLSPASTMLMWCT